MACRGISGNRAESGFWAKTIPPSCLMAWMPSEPSESLPDSTTPIASPAYSCGERREQRIHGKMPLECRPLCQLKAFLGDGERRIRRNDIDVIGLHDLGVARQSNRNTCRPRQDLGQQAFVVRVEMLNDDIRGAGSGGDRAQELAGSLETAGRGADTDNAERHVLSIQSRRVYAALASAEAARSQSPLANFRPYCRALTPILSRRRCRRRAARPRLDARTIPPSRRREFD